MNSLRGSRQAFVACALSRCDLRQLVQANLLLLSIETLHSRELLHVVVHEVVDLRADYRPQVRIHSLRGRRRVALLRHDRRGSALREQAVKRELVGSARLQLGHIDSHFVIVDDVLVREEHFQLDVIHVGNVICTFLNHTNNESLDCVLDGPCFLVDLEGYRRGIGRSDIDTQNGGRQSELLVLYMVNESK